MKGSTVAGCGCISIGLLLGGCMAFYEWTPADKAIMRDYDAQKAAEQSHAVEWVRDEEDLSDAHYFQPHVKGDVSDPIVKIIDDQFTKVPLFAGSHVTATGAPEIRTSSQHEEVS